MKKLMRTALAALVFAAAIGGASASAQSNPYAREQMRARERGSANAVQVTQDGNNNGVGVSQVGAGNTTRVAQRGDSNVAVSAQNGNYNYSRLVQMGEGNTLTATQNNNNNALCFVQRGDYLGADVVQNGNDSVILVQNPRGEIRQVTDRVPRPCQTGPRAVPNPNRGAWR